MRLQQTILTCSLLSLVLSLPCLAAEPKSTLANFDSGPRPAEWGVNFGHWEPEGGVLVARQLDKDMHPAASRWRIPLSDAVIKLRFRLIGAKAFHVGFDPAPGQLQKMGHLYSLVVTPGEASIKKHKDKSNEQSKDETLATAKSPQLAGKEWLTLELRTVGDRVTALVGTEVKLEATDPSFHVAKPGVVFRVVGGDVQLDDVEVAVTKANP